MSTRSAARQYVQQQRAALRDMGFMLETDEDDDVELVAVLLEAGRQLPDRPQPAEAWAFGGPLLGDLCQVEVSVEPSRAETIWAWLEESTRTAFAEFIRHRFEDGSALYLRTLTIAPESYLKPGRGLAAQTLALAERLAAAEQAATHWRKLAEQWQRAADADPDAEMVHLDVQTAITLELGETLADAVERVKEQSREQGRSEGAEALRLAETELRIARAERDTALELLKEEGQRKARAVLDEVFARIEARSEGEPCGACNGLGFVPVDAEQREQIVDAALAAQVTVSALGRELIFNSPANDTNEPTGFWIGELERDGETRFFIEHDGNDHGWKTSEEAQAALLSAAIEVLCADEAAGKAAIERLCADEAAGKEQQP